MEYKLLTILWKQNSPYGTYNAGDSVRVFFDDSTGSLKVYKNSTQIFSGDQIPPTFIYSGNNQFYYLSQELDQVLVCYGKSKLKYERRGDFPYLSLQFLYNHPSCNVAIACDLEYTKLPTITDASSETATDGQIVVTTSSSNGPVQYSLGSDFSYGYGQNIGTFGGLRAGVYTIYARDTYNCRSVITTKVGVAKTYGVKYRIQYDNPFGQVHKTEILERGFAGGTTDVNGTTSPSIYRLRGEGEKDKFVTILPGELEVNLISESEGYYSEIFTNDPEKYRVRHTIDNDVVWTGKVLTNQFEESYITPPYPIQVIASDGLPLLSEIPFLDDFGQRLEGSIKQINLIAFILRKIGLELNIRSGCNIYASSMAKTASDDPLDQAYLDVSRYYLIKQNPTCREVLEYLLQPYNAHIIQWDNCWNIVRSEERIDNFDYREYDADGVYVSNSTYTSLINLENSFATNRMVWKDRNQVLRIMPGFGSIRLNYDLGYKGNILRNGDFKLSKTTKYDLVIGDQSNQVVADLTGWNIYNSLWYNQGNGTYVGYEKIDDNNIAVALTPAIPNSGNYLYSDSYLLKMGTLDKVRLSMRYKIQRFRDSSAYDFKYVRVRIVVQYGDYYLGNNGNWYAAYTEIINYVNRDDANKYIDWELIATCPLDPVTLLPSTDFTTGQAFSIKVILPNANDAEYWTGNTADNLDGLRALFTTNLPIDSRTELLDISQTYTPTGVTTGSYIFYYELKYDKNAESLPNIVRPDDYNATTNPKQWILTGIQLYDTTVQTSIIIDNIKAEILAGGETMPLISSYEQSMENANNLPINKEIYHGSLTNNGQTLISYGINIGFGINIFGSSGAVAQTTDNSWSGKIDYIANAADISYSGYLRNSNGVGYENWSRSGYSENKTLEKIFMDSYSSQYNQPWRMISGDMYSDDTFFSPLNCLQETMDNNRIYMPVSLEIDFYQNVYSCEFVELFDINQNSPAGFTTGFTLGFNA